MTYTNQNQDMRTVMSVIAERQRILALTHDDVARSITEIAGYSITGAEWRSCVQGLTRKVPLWAVLAAAHTLMIPAHVLFPMLEEY